MSEEDKYPLLKEAALPTDKVSKVLRNSISNLGCTEGSDQVCIDKQSEGQCCTLFEVYKPAIAPTSSERIAIAFVKSVGIPTTISQGPSFYCVSRDTVRAGTNENDLV